MPVLFKPGDQTQTENSPGMTAKMPPPTPLLAGKPVAYSHLPESSYRPAVAITASTFGTYFACSTDLLVSGFVPPFASVAAMVAAEVLDAVDADRAYVFPTLEARALWWAQRASPAHAAELLVGFARWRKRRGGAR